MLHMAAYSASLAAGPNLDTTAAADGVFQVRNNHLIFTDPMNVLAAVPIGALITRARFNNAQLTQVGIPHLWPLLVSATVPNLPFPVDYTDEPLELPQNEEIIIETSNSAVGPTQTSVGLLLADPDHTMNLPNYERQLTVRGTAAPAAGSETTWGPEATVIFERDLLNGVYAVIGASVVASAALFFRMRFPDQRPKNGKQFRPGGMVQESAALLPWPKIGRAHV